MKKKINLSFYILILAFIQVIITDNIIYFLHLRYLIANIIALIINIVLNIILIKKKILVIENTFKRWDCIFGVIIIVITGLTIFFSDEFWDTYSYHLYVGQNPFTDKINSDFFPGRTLTSYVFPLVDRLFYMSRIALGFRLGTLPGYLIIVVMFYEIKKILKYLLENKIKESYLSILSILPICTFIILQQLGTYYIDNFSIVLLLEFTYIVLTESKDLFKNKPQLYYLILIVGITTCIKITNAIYMIAPLIYLLIKNIKNIKEIKWYDYLLLIVSMFIPILPYFINAIIQTGSPVFPYYNTIFNSEYFENYNWVDNRYGPKSLLQYLIWPIYIIFNPTKAYEANNTDLSFAVGYVSIISYLIYNIFKKFVKKEEINKKNFKYAIILLYFYLVWQKFMIGYTRYAGIIPVLSNIFIIAIFVKVIEKQKIIGAIILISLMTISTYNAIYEYIYNSSLYNYILLINNQPYEVEYIKQNIRNIFKDKVNEKYDIDGVWGVIYDDSAVPMLLNVDDKLVNLEYGTKTGQTEKSKQIYWENVLNNDIYVPLYTFKLDGKLMYLDKFNFEITEITHIIKNETFLRGDSFLYIVKVKYNENIEGNKEIFENLLSKWN